MHSERTHPIRSGVVNPGDPLAGAKRDTESQAPKRHARINGLLFPRLRREREAHAATVTQLASAQSQLAEFKGAAMVLHEMANTDMLTGLGNRRMFDSRFDEELTLFLRSGRGLALLVIDLDNFKVVNDSFGHDFGDVVLKEASGKLLSAVRHADLVFRMGGDEFAVLVPSGNIDIAQTIKERIKHAFADQGTNASAGSGLTISNDSGPGAASASNGNISMGASVGFTTISSEIESGSASSREWFLDQIAHAPSGDRKEFIERTYIGDLGKALIRSADAQMYADKQSYR